jgi:hypothetical protein
VRLGGFMPTAKAGDKGSHYDIFSDHTTLFNIERKDWTGAFGGFEYSKRIDRNVEIGFHIDGYGKELDTHYREYLRKDGTEIEQTLRLMIAPMGATVRFISGRRGHIAPYLAAGVDLFVYRYEAFGDFVIDFNDLKMGTRWDSFVSDGVAPGIHVAAGVRVPMSHDLNVTGEVRYGWAKTNMRGDFDQNRIDLSGLSTTIGVNLRF